MTLTFKQRASPQGCASSTPLPLLLLPKIPHPPAWLSHHLPPCRSALPPIPPPKCDPKQCSSERDHGSWAGKGSIRGPREAPRLRHSFSRHLLRAPGSTPDTMVSEWTDGDRGDSSPPWSSNPTSTWLDRALEGRCAGFSSREHERHRTVERGGGDARHVAVWV